MRIAKDWTDKKKNDKYHNIKKHLKQLTLYVIMRCSDDLWINQWLKTRHIDTDEWMDENANENTKSSHTMHLHIGM